MSIGQDIKEKTSYQQTCYRCKEYKHNDKSDEYKHTEQKINTVLIWCKKKAHFGKAIIGRFTVPKSNSNFHSQKGEENSEPGKSLHNLEALMCSMLSWCKIQLICTSGRVVVCLVWGPIVYACMFVVCMRVFVRVWVCWGGLHELGHLLCNVIKEDCWSLKLPVYWLY